MLHIFKYIELSYYDLYREDDFWIQCADRLNLSQNTYSLLQHVTRIFPNLRSLTLTNYERSEAFLDGKPREIILSCISYTKKHTFSCVFCLLFQANVSLFTEP